MKGRAIGVKVLVDYHDTPNKVSICQAPEGETLWAVSGCCQSYIELDTAITWCCSWCRQNFYVSTGWYSAGIAVRTTPTPSLKAWVSIWTGIPVEQIAMEVFG